MVSCARPVAEMNARLRSHPPTHVWQLHNEHDGRRTPVHALVISLNNIGGFRVLGYELVHVGVCPYLIC